MARAIVETAAIRQIKAFMVVSLLERESVWSCGCGCLVSDTYLIRVLTLKVRTYGSLELNLWFDFWGGCPLAPYT